MDAGKHRKTYIVRKWQFPNKNELVESGVTFGIED